MSIFKEQRVGVLVDIQNLYYSAKVLYQKKVNFGQLLRHGVGDRKLIRAIAYGIKTLEGQEEKFFEAMEKQGFEVTYVPVEPNGIVNPEKIKKAQGTLKYALIGFIFFISSFLILNIIDILFLGGKGKIFEFKIGE